MTSAEIAIAGHGNGQLAERDVVDGWLAMASDVIKLANVIAPTEFVPAEYRDNPPAVAAAILSGRELGIGPMTALRHVQMVKGTPTLSAEYKRARVLAAGHEFDVLELNTQRCKVSGRRKGSNKPPLEILFTMEDAKIAGLLAPSRSGKPGAWQTRPRRMLFARAGSELCDFLFADVVNGLPTAELVADGADDEEFAGYNEAPAAPPDAPKPRTAQRRQPSKTPAAQVGEPAATPDAGKPPPPAPPATSGPPLPGEDDTTQEEPDPGSPGTAAKEQLTALWATFTEDFQFTKDDKAQARSTVEQIIGRQLAGATTADLSHNEASAVIDTLKRCGTRERLVVLLATGDVPDDEGDGGGDGGE